MKQWLDGLVLNLFWFFILMAVSLKNILHKETQVLMEKYIHIYKSWGFPDSSVGKESACNAGDPSSIPRSGKSPGEGIGYPLQYSLISLVTQLVKNPPAIWETRVWFLGWEDFLEKGKATHSSILAWRIPWTVKSMGSQRVRHDWATSTFTYALRLINKFASSIMLISFFYKLKESI